MSTRAGLGPTRLTFLGAAGTVTGSKFLVESPEARVLVDCGMFQGHKDLRRRNWEPLDLDAARLDAVVLTHAHLDHTGYLPRLVRQGFTGRVLCSAGTAALTELVLRDAAHLQEEDAAYAARAGYSRHDKPEPLFDSADAEQALALVQPQQFDQFVPLAGDMRLRMRPAGHIYGSSVVTVEADGARVTFSGDLGRDQHPLLRAPVPPDRTDTLVVESTYGDRTHVEDPEERLAAAISRTVRRGGVALLPAFAVDRTAMLLNVLATLAGQQRIPDVPVYVDSPMALSALEIYRRAIEEGDPQFRPELLNHRLPLSPPGTRLMRTTEQSATLNEPRRPCIIVSASGMATGGRVLHHLKHQLPNPANSVILTGFQVPGTRGRSLADGTNHLKIHGQYVPVRAEVFSVEGFSAHADADELASWVRHADPPPRTTYVVHGEPDSSEALRARLTEDLGLTAVVPRMGERVLIAGGQQD